ncbi:hypothetical protein ABK040_016130 [Willaertia magna]
MSDLNSLQQQLLSQNVNYNTLFNHFQQQQQFNLQFPQQQPVQQQQEKNVNDASLSISLRDPIPNDLIIAGNLNNNIVFDNNYNNDNYNVSENVSKEEIVNINSLNNDELMKMYERLPYLEIKDEDMKDFNKRESSLKPPKSSNLNILQFPLQEDLQMIKPKELKEEEFKLNNSDLEIIRYLPEGNISDRSIPFISITFSQPMIKLSTVYQVEEQPIPVRIEPIPKNGGRWRWIGTNNVQYEPNYRFDMSTEYKVTIPKGISSVLGGQLKNDTIFKFSTPRALVRNHLPTGIHPMNEVPVYYLEFDQDIDPAVVVSFILTKPLVRAKLISNEEVRKLLTEYNFEKRAPLSYTVFDSKLKSAPPNRHVWFTLENNKGGAVTFNTGENVQFVVTEGVPSLEGPLVTTEKFEFNVRNYSELKVITRFGGEIPMDTFRIQFNNTLDAEDFNEDMISIEPTIERRNIAINGNYLIIGGNIKGRTTYKVTLSTKMKDVWGQTLKNEETITFNVGRAKQSLQAFQKGLIVIDPTVKEKPSFSVFTVNLDKIHVIVTQVTPELYYSTHNNFQMGQIVGTKVLDTVIDTNGQPDEPKTTDIDLSLCLQYPTENLGLIMIWVKPERSCWQSDWTYAPLLSACIQVTKLAVDCLYDKTTNTVFAWTNSLISGEIMKDAKISIKTKLEVLNTSVNNDGTTQFTLLNSKYDNNYNTILIYAERNNDCCFISPLPIYRNRGLGNIVTRFIDDRGLYKPNEEVFIKGFVRNVKWVDNNTRYEIVLPQPKTIEYAVIDSMRNQYHKGACEITKSGSIQFSFKVPDNVNLGKHTIQFTFDNNEICHHYFQCQEFRTPEFTVNSNVPVSNYIVNDSAICTTSAQYYSGGGLSGATVNYTVKQSVAFYSPPNWRDFTFSDSQRTGIFTSQVSTFNSSLDNNGENKIVIEFKENDRIHKSPITLNVESVVQDINRQTISSSSNILVHPCKLYCGIRLKKNYFKPKQDSEIELIVVDVNGKAIEGVDIKLKIEKTEWKTKGMKFVSEQKVIAEEVLQSSNESIKYILNMNEGGSYIIKLEIVDKETNLTNSCSSLFYVFGGDLNRNKQKNNRINSKNVTLVADKTYYDVGDVAQISIQSPFNGKSEGFIIFSLQGIIHKDYITIDPEKGFTEYLFPITKEHIPNLNVKVSLVGSESRIDDVGNELGNMPNQPAFAFGGTILAVSKLNYSLTVDILPENQYVTPGSTTKVDIIVKDREGNLQENSEVTLIAVDEAILSLSNRFIYDPLHTFIFNYHSSETSHSIRSNLYVKDYSSIHIEKEVVLQTINNSQQSQFGFPIQMQMQMQMPMNNSFSFNSQPTREAEIKGNQKKRKECKETSSNNKESGPMIKVRNNFNPLAVFVPSVITNNEGKATISFTLPDNLTKYRLTAIAVKGSIKAGIKENFIIAQLPLAIRPSLPRFLNFGDRAEFSCVLVNQTPITLPVNVAIRFTNLSILDESKRGLFVNIPSLQRIELRFPLQTEKVGIARFQIGVAIANQFINFADAVEKEVRVFTPATTEAFATYGEMDDTSNVFQKIERPKDVFSQFGGLDISTSSTALSSLTDAFLYLYNYPYDCSEQLTSKLISTVSLKDVLQAFNVKGIPSSVEIDKFINETLTLLYKKQFPNGGYGFWSYYNEAIICPYITVFVLYGFTIAIKAGYSVDTNRLQTLVNLVSNIEQYLIEYSIQCQHSIKSFACYVLALLYQLKQKRSTNISLNPQVIKQSILKLFKESGMKTNLECLMWMAHGLYLIQNNLIENEGKEILKHILMNVNETAETANFITDYGDNHNSKLVMLHSSRRTDGIILNSLIELDKNNQLIPKIVKGLLAHKKKGRWNNTQENVYILVALNNYFHTFENITPDFITRIWLGEDFCGEQVFKGRSKDENLVQIPMNLLVESNNINQQDSNNNNSTLVISKEGQGRLYYRLGLSYAPTKLLLPPISYGFIVERTYEGIGQNKDQHVQFDLNRNCWRFKAGEVIRIKLTLTTTSRRYHVALVDYLPACLEALNPELKGTPNTSTICKEENNKRFCWWNRTWYEHENIRDERVEAFTSLLYEGSFEFKYLARVTTIGSFVIPPAKAEEMYSPELFGRSGTAFVEVFE